MLKRFIRAFNLQALDRSLGLGFPGVSSLWATYERLKEKFPGPADAEWLEGMREMIEEDVELELSGRSAERQLH